FKPEARYWRTPRQADSRQRSGAIKRRRAVVRRKVELIRSDAGVFVVELSEVALVRLHWLDSSSCLWEWIRKAVQLPGSSSGLRITGAGGGFVQPAAAQVLPLQAEIDGLQARNQHLDNPESEVQQLRRGHFDRHDFEPQLCQAVYASIDVLFDVI